MSVKNDAWIRQMAVEQNMISPFEPYQVRKKGVISYGTSSFGYDMRIGNEFKIFTPKSNKPINPKRINSEIFNNVVVEDSSPVTIPAFSYALGFSVETFSIPDDVIVLVIGKSTYARAGLIVNVTPGEPGWKGQWTIELLNATPLPMYVFPNEGIAQCVFFQGERPEITYADKIGKYMNQIKITLPKVENVDV
jgi:dCTP deaminase